MMTSWTPEDSRILSQMLDEVVGTQEIIDIRQDYCRMLDSLLSIFPRLCTYFTGSKAEGLQLPGSDEDYMHDINYVLSLKVVQSLDNVPDTSSYSVFLMYTENVSPGFALLQHVNQNTINPILYSLSQSINGLPHLSSDLLAQSFSSQHTENGERYERHGPSLEYWTKFEDKSESGRDNVPSIHCKFWPKEAAEWIDRLRNFNWPTSFDISSIIGFGCHLVPVGHPLSDIKSMEWRISFSLAERALVWSFNHVQMQCYALMKIILKEFIKVRCNPQNQVLCSYFIKTFLFWKYEATKLNFWRTDNLRECMKYLLSEFSQCIREGVLRHYFIPRFNLLSIKLTRAAQIELLQLFDVVIQKDITIVKECKTLQNIWSEFLKVKEHLNNVSNLKRNIIVMNDICMMRYVVFFKSAIYTAALCSRMDMYQMSSNGPLASFFSIISKNISSVFCRTPLKTITLRICLFMDIRSLIKNSCGSGNKGDYQLQKVAQNDTLSFDISTCKLWCAILLYMKGDCLSTLDIVNQVLSSIPPYVMYNESVINEGEQLYADMFLDSHSTATQRARKAWMFCLEIIEEMISMPTGIQIELYSHKICYLSPFTCAYYLQFLCYHDMRQYNRRDRALRQLTEVATNPEQRGNPLTAFNIAGHCMLLVGKRDQARDMFYRSYTWSQRFLPLDEYNSALWYLQNFC